MLPKTTPTACLSVPAVCTPEKHEFVSKIFRASGISYERTAVPPCLQPERTDEPKTDLNHAQAEAKLVYRQVIERVLAKTGACGWVCGWAADVVCVHVWVCMSAAPVCVSLLARWSHFAASTRVAGQHPQLPTPGRLVTPSPMTLAPHNRPEARRHRHPGHKHVHLLPCAVHFGDGG